MGGGGDFQAAERVARERLCAGRAFRASRGMACAFSAARALLTLFPFSR